MSRRSASAKVLGITVRRGEAHQHLAVGGDVDPADRDVSEVMRKVAWGTGAVKRTSSSTAWGILLESACSARS